jgi:hypothetical protein
MLALRAGRPLLLGGFKVLISVRGRIDSRAVVVPQEGRVQLQNSVASLRIKPSTVRLVA